MTTPKVTIVDYGLGNLFSIVRAVQFNGGSAEISADPRRLENAERVILPGVGAFGEGMRRLCENGLESGLRRFVEKERPLLGICLGMQLLMTESQEFGLHRGLDILKGTVRRFREPLAGEVAFKIPHIGWSTAERVTEGGTKESNGPAALFQGIPVGTFFYFVHSFFCVPEDPQAIFSRTDYGRDRFCSVVNRHSVWGCQFHPEKSGPDGMQLYHNFLFNL